MFGIFTYISCKGHIFTAEMDKNSRTALCSTYFIYVMSHIPLRMMFLRSYYLAQWCAKLKLSSSIFKNKYKLRQEPIVMQIAE